MVYKNNKFINRESVVYKLKYT